METKFKKYKKNLCAVQHMGNTYVKSNDTLVARVDYCNKELIQLGYWSVTTQKHINYAASVWGLKLIKSK